MTHPETDQRPLIWWRAVLWSPVLLLMFFMQPADFIDNWKKIRERLT